MIGDNLKVLRNAGLIIYVKTETKENNGVRNKLRNGIGFVSMRTKGYRGSFFFFFFRISALTTTKHLYAGSCMVRFVRMKFWVLLEKNYIGLLHNFKF